MRQAVRARRRRRPPLGRARRATGAAAVAVPEPALGLRLPDPARPRRRRRPRRADPVRVALRAAGPRPRSPAVGRWHAARLRRPPRRPGARPAGPGGLGLRRVAAARERPGRRRLRRAHPHRRGAVTPLGQLEPGRSRSAVPGHGDDGQLRRHRTHGRPGGRAARRQTPGDARRGLGRRAGRALGPDPPRRRRRARADAQRCVEHLLSRLRARRARTGAGAGRAAGRRRHRHGARRRPPQRDRRHRRRPPGGLTTTG